MEDLTFANFMSNNLNWMITTLKGCLVDVIVTLGFLFINLLIQVELFMHNVFSLHATDIIYIHQF